MKVIVMSLIHILHLSQIKKEEARDYLVAERKRFAIVSLVPVIIFSALVYFVFPPIKILMEELEASASNIINAQYAAYMFITIFSGSFIYFFTSAPDFQKLEKVLKRYSHGEMISTHQISQTLRLEIISYALVGLAVAYIVFSVISPIYQMAGN